MKKIVSAADLGGAPFTKADLRLVFNSEIWDAVEGILSPFATGPRGIIISGCDITANGSGFDMTSGVVYLNGKFLRVEAVTAQSFTKNIYESATATPDSRTFADSSTHTLFNTYFAIVAAPGGGTGQFISISSLTSAEQRRWSNLIQGCCVSRARVEAAGDGTITFQGGIPISSSDETSTEVTITHNLGTSNYIVQLTSITGDPLAVTSPGPFSFKIANTAGGSRSACFMSIVMV